MSNDKNDLLKKHLGDDFEDVLGGVLDETFGDDELEQVQDEEEDSDFDFSQFSSILDELEEEDKPKKEDDTYFNLDGTVEEEVQEGESEEDSFDFDFDFSETVETEEQPEEIHEEEEDFNDFDFVDVPVKEQPKAVEEQRFIQSNSEDIFTSINSKIEALEKAKKALEEQKERQEQLRLQLEEVVHTVLSHVVLKSIDRKALSTTGKVEEYFSAKGLYLLESKNKRYELWLLLDGTFVEFVKSTKPEHDVEYTEREVSENLPNLENWGLENILFALNDRLNDYLHEIEEKIKRLS